METEYIIHLVIVNTQVNKNIFLPMLGYELLASVSGREKILEHPNADKGTIQDDGRGR
jgi:hypothetical protein